MEWKLQYSEDLCMHFVMSSTQSLVGNMHGVLEGPKEILNMETNVWEYFSPQVFYFFLWRMLTNSP